MSLEDFNEDLDLETDKPIMRAIEEIAQDDDEAFQIWEDGYSKSHSYEQIVALALEGMTENERESTKIMHWGQSTVWTKAEGIILE